MLMTFTMCFGLDSVVEVRLQFSVDCEIEYANEGHEQNPGTIQLLLCVWLTKLLSS